MRPGWMLLWLAGLTGAFLLGRTTRATSPGEITSATESPARKAPARASSRLDSGTAATSFSRSLLQAESSAEFQTMFGDLLPDLADSRTHDALFVLADAWSAKSPEEAVAWLDTLEFGDERNPFLFSALTQWAGQDPAAAQGWLDSHHADSGRNYLLAAMVRGMAWENPALAWDLLLAAPPSPERLGAVDFVLRGWAREGTEHALAQVASLPDSEVALKQRAIKHLIKDLPPEELASARRWAGELPFSDRESAQTTIAANWSQHDPTAALAWANTLAEDAIRPRVFGEIATRWARRDPSAASDWLAARTEQPEYDLAARAVAWTTVGLDPDLAFVQVAGITRPPLRDETFEQLGRIWLSDRPQEAKHYFEGESPIPPAIRARLLLSFE